MFTAFCCEQPTVNGVFWGSQKTVCPSLESAQLARIICGSVSFDAVQVVVFDKDGTLANSQAFLQSLGQKRAHLIDAQVPGVAAPLLRSFGLEGDRIHPAGLLAVGTRQENEIAAAAYIAATGKDWTMALKLAQSAFWAADQWVPRRATSTPLFDGIIPLLQRLVDAGLQLAIVSSDSPANVRDFIESYQLHSLISFALGAEPGCSKPDPDPLLRVCQALGVVPQQTLVIGDSAADLEMAIAAGAGGCVAVNWGWSDPIDLPQAAATLQSCAEIQVFMA